jgi:nicotinate-nucleotide adenylyltransferase
MIFRNTFDPVTAGEVRYLLQYRKLHGIRDIYVRVEGDGILSIGERKKLLKLALKPYRHLHVSDETEGGEQLTGFAEEEERVRHGEFVLAAPGIRNVLVNNGYYFRQVMDHMCRPHRAVHSLGVAETAASLARFYGYDEDIAYRSGLLHDITKIFTDEENEKIIRIYKPEWLELSPKVWHSYTAVIWLKRNMCLHDRRILNAIEHHTLGDGRSGYCHILYIADKIEPNRVYECEKERAAAYAGLQSGAVFVRNSAQAHIKP